jgi:glycogen(starch) synthase
MKVLMLGWEFPPHISGGLGTACFGLTQGLAQQGVAIQFVVPRAYGDEDGRFVDLVGANQILLEEREQDPPRRVVRERVETIAETDAVVERFAIDSALSPYAGEAEYAERVVQRQTVRTRTLRVEELEQDPPRVRRRVLELSGAYGPNLFDEVEAYAEAVEFLGRGLALDVIHAHDWMSAPAGLALQRATGKPLVFHVHACEFDRSGAYPSERVRAIEQLALERADRVVCVSHYTAQVLERNYRVDSTRLRVVHNALTHKEQQERIHYEKPFSEPLVLFLGRVTSQKGPDYFLDAAAAVVRVRPDVKFVMSGSGDMLPKMIERAARLGLARNMHFTGFLKGLDVERMYAMADVYVMPSVSEPFGISPLEAMALDVPVIVSRQSGVSEVVKSALKVDFWDVQGIAEKILAVLNYPALVEELMERGREEVRALRWEYPARLVRDVYRELVHAR